MPIHNSKGVKVMKIVLCNMTSCMQVFSSCQSYPCELITKWGTLISAKGSWVVVQVACGTLADQAWMGQLREEEEQEKHPVPLEKHTCSRCSKSHAPINV